MLCFRVLALLATEEGAKPSSGIKEFGPKTQQGSPGEDTATWKEVPHKRTIMDILCRLGCRLNST